MFALVETSGDWIASHKARATGCVVNRTAIPALAPRRIGVTNGPGGAIQVIGSDGSGAGSDRCAEAADVRFHNDIFAVVSPQAVFEERPFPLLQGLGVNLCVRIKPPTDANKRRATEQDGPQWEFAIVPLGRNVPRLLPMPSDRGHAYVLLEELVAHYIDDFFPGREVWYQSWRQFDRGPHVPSVSR